ncbi:MAG: ABC transporter permease [Methanosarcinales archaeon]|nr:ABC transporter permease [Methanosarcinales archaeon]
MFEFTVARKHMVSNPKMVLFTVMSVALAVAVIVLMMGLMEGYRGEIIKSTVENNPHIIISSKENEDYISLYRTLSSTVWDYPDVQAVSPRLLGKAGAKYKDEVRGVSFVGADPAQEDPLMHVQEDVVEGDYLDLVFKKHSAILGTKLAEELEVKPGDDFYLIRMNRSLKLEVVGLIQTGTGSDESLVYLPLEAAQDLMDQGDVVSQVGVRLGDIYAAPSITDDLNARTSYDVKSWQDQSRDTLELLDTQKAIMYIFYFLVFVIAGFGVANAMIMIVSRRTKEIGILMAMGTTGRSIVQIFLTESVIQAPPAALLGCLMAYIVARLIEAYPIEMPSDIYMVSRMTVTLTQEVFVYAVGFAILVNLAAGVYPAYKASRLDPVAAIATE